MQWIRRLPAPILFVAGVILLMAAAVVVWAATTAVDKTGYDFAKDVALPLVGPIVSILVPTVLFYLIPLAQNRQKATIDLFNASHTEDMRKSRNDAWNHLVTERLSLPEPERTKQLDDYLTEQEFNQTVTPDVDEKYQKASRGLDFFVVVNSSLREGTLDPGMVRSLFGYYYLWWRDEIMIPLRGRPLAQAASRSHRPLWWSSLKQMDEVCKPDDTPATSK